MNTQNVIDAVISLLSSSDCEIICISGKWGTGKSHMIETTLARLKNEKLLAFKSYSIVSLFGLANSSEILRRAYVNSEISINPDSSNLTPTEIGIKRFYERTNRIFAQFGGQANIPHVVSVGPLIDAAINKYFESSIVCIDDVERRANSVDLRSVMGIANKLKIENKCKVIIILNLDALGDEELAEFEKYFEKTIDHHLRYAPTPDESLSIAIPGDGYLENTIKKNLKNLMVTNIRVASKIYKRSQMLWKICNEREDEIVDDLMKQFAFIAWSVFDKESGPSGHFLQRYRGYSFDRRDKTEDDIRWEGVARSYGFGSFDDFDLQVLKALQQGYFIADKIKPEIDKKYSDLEGRKARAAVSAIWDRLFNKLDMSESDVAKNVEADARKSMKIIYPRDMDSIVSLLKSFGETKLALGLLDDYVKLHADEPEIFNLSPPLGPQDPDVRVKYEEVTQKNAKPRLSLSQVGANMRESGGMQELERRSIQSLSEQEMYDELKTATGIDLKNMIYALSFVRETQSVDEDWKAMRKRIDAVFDRISAESSYNKRLIGALARR